MVRVLSIAAAVATFFVGNAAAFTQPSNMFGARTISTTPLQHQPSSSAPKMSSFDDDFLQETPEVAQQRIKDLVDENPVLLFMKGTQLFPQCGFSSTAVQILNTFGLEFRSVDVLSDEAIRQGVKDFSQWPTIPQLYVCGEFIGGSDIMIEMYQNGELGEMIEKAKADMV